MANELSSLRRLYESVFVVRAQRKTPLQAMQGRSVSGAVRFCFLSVPSHSVQEKLPFLLGIRIKSHFGDDMFSQSLSFRCCHGRVFFKNDQAGYLIPESVKCASKFSGRTNFP